MWNFLEETSGRLQGGFMFEDVTDEAHVFNDTYVIELRGSSADPTVEPVRQTWTIKGLRLDFNGEEAVLDMAKQLFNGAQERYLSRRPWGVPR